MPLLDWQVPLCDELQDKVQQSRVVVNALPTGVGKTYLGAELASRLDLKPFVISPKSVIGAWRNVLDQWDVGPVDVINLEKLRTKKTEWFNGSWHLPTNSLVIVDEIHRGCSGRDSDSGKMVALLKATGLPVVMSSATLADSPLKMRTSGYLLDLHRFNAASYYQWCYNNGCYLVKNPNGSQRMVFTDKEALARKHMNSVFSSISSRVLHRSLDEIPGFPERIVEAKLYDLAEDKRAAIATAYEEIVANPDKMLAGMVAQRQSIELAKVDLLVELTKEILEENRSVVVFFSFREPMRQYIEKLGMPVSQIHGDQTSGHADSERDREIRLFQENHRHVCVAQSNAGGLGVSLHDVRKERERIALINPDWSASTITQVLGRIHRAGGTRALERFVLVGGTLEERIYKAIGRKMQCIETLNHGDLLHE